MIPGDIGARLAQAVRAAVADGALPARAGGLTAAGTWRPAPAAAGGGPGVYASTLPFALARLAGRPAASISAGLAGHLVAAGDGIAAATATGEGYLTVTVTDAALAGLAPRIALAGPGCARSDALSGHHFTAAPRPDLSAAAGWPQAWRWQADFVTARLAEVAGATITSCAERAIPPSSPPPPRSAPVPLAVRYAGADAVRYALTRLRAGRRAWMAVEDCVMHDSSNPLRAVSLAHADAASVLRWAADLGLRRCLPVALAPELLSAQAERRLLELMSWLPERAAGAARRSRPDEFAAYLEHLAGRWLDCREGCPALPFGGQLAPRQEAVIAARLWLADAARTALAAGLALIGAAAPPRL